MTTPRAADPGRRPDIEADLKDKYHADFLYCKNIAIDEFDIEKSLDNQARFDPLDEETVEVYKEAIERGDAFPAVLAYRPGRGARPKLVIIDGNHRLIGHQRADNRPINVYEIARGTKAQTIMLMMYEFNTKHGRPTSQEERIAQAIHLVDAGATHDQAAAAVNVPINLLKRAATSAQADRRADEVSADRREWEAIPKPVRHRLQTINTDEGFAAAIHLAYVANLSTDEAKELVASMNTTKGASRQRAIVKSETDRYQERIQGGGAGLTTGANPRRRTMSPRARLSMFIGQALTLPDDVAGLASTYAEPERVEVAIQVEDASQKLHKLARALNPSLR